MAQEHERTEVAYGEGWDAESGAVVGPVDAATARARDVVGAWYVAVLREPSRPHPVAVLHVGWEHHYLGLWTFAADGRRVLEADLRLEDGRLVVAFARGWGAGGLDLPAGAAVEAPEFGDWDRLVADVAEAVTDGAARVRVGETGAVAVAVVPTARPRRRILGTVWTLWRRSVWRPVL
ncbi:hypothetical protein [Streptomyces sp. GC420]|uniref:hypothetical protein n=1 Tax=Streptomyces sp. GC420 TaxID=2697568 RepID=UPI001414F0E0|nr:hypothetical protein [Streptomyces sp. GC420]NBM16197.1 hypothetical protein [Streptomyces sp. GC420]